MNDFDYENLQKKRTAQGARHKKGGSKSRKCTLPSDYLTKAQKEALNGPTHELNLNQPLSWADFKSIPTDSLKRTYLLNLLNTYKPSANMLAEMFDVTTRPVTMELRRLGIPVSGKGGRRAAEKKAAWAAFCNGVIGGGDNVQPKEETTTEEPQVTCYDVDAEAFERAKAAVDLLCNAEEKTEETTLNLCDPAHPDHVNARRCEDPDPVEPDPDEVMADAILDAFNKACEPTPCAMSKLATTMTGSPDGVVDNIRDLLSLFSGKVSVKLSVEVAE